MAMRQREAVNRVQPELFDFGPDVPFTITAAAKRYLKRVPEAGWREMVDAVEDWAEKVGVSKAALSVYVDPEFPSWRYLHLNLLVPKTRKSSFSLSDDLYDDLGKVTSHLDSDARVALFRDIFINAVPAREWDDEPSFTI